MTPLLEQAIAEVKKLSSEEQDNFARWMLAELANVQHWHQSADQKADFLEWFADDPPEEDGMDSPAE